MGKSSGVNRLVLLIFLGLLNVLSTVFFVWHAELYMFQIENGFSRMFLTNGFFVLSSSQVYHLFMYFMFFVVFLTSTVLILFGVLWLRRDS